ncbi:MAG TPA: hypothetical protein VGG48_12490 [Rhizomicrobium sp.]
MANPLAAASVLLAVVAVLYGAWNGDVANAINLKFASQPENRGPAREQIRNAINTKALPLTLGCWLSVAVFAWRVANLITGAIGCLYSTSCVYDDVGAAFVLTEAFVIVIAISATRQLIQLQQKLNASYK